MNVGNTSTRVVRFLDDHIVEDRRAPTERVGAGEVPRLEPGIPIVITSVVPAVTRVLQHFWRDHVLFLTAAERAKGLSFSYDPPGGLGADRLANAYAMFARHGCGLAIDFGTATTLTLVTPDGTMRGGAIMPGLTTAMASLKRGTALLPEVAVEAPEGAWGTNTREAIQIGVVHGAAGAVRHLASRMRAPFPTELPVAITGGWAELMQPLLPADFSLEPLLTVEGARAMYLCNTRGSLPAPRKKK